MRRNIKDYTIDTFEVEHPNFGRGFKSETYVQKDNGKKEDIRTLGCYGNRVKSHKEMLEYTINIFNL